MLKSLKPREDAADLLGPHVQRIPSKLPGDLVSYLARHVYSTSSDTQYNLVDFAAWVKGEDECQSIVAQTRNLHIGALQVHRRKPVEVPSCQQPSFPKELTESCPIKLLSQRRNHIFQEGSAVHSVNLHHVTCQTVDV